MAKVNSLGVFVGTGKCNARCEHCAGIIHRKYAPKEDGLVDSDLIYKTIKNCYEQGARSLSLTSSGEPTLSPLSVTKVLELINSAKNQGIEYSPINLYSNGIRIGEDKDFCEKYLGLWRENGLRTVYVTVHDTDESKNAKLYGVETYPSLAEIIQRIHTANLGMRANLVLGKKTIDSFDKFVSTASHLKKLGADYISAWSVRNMDDEVDRGLSLPEKELDRIENWAEENQDSRCKIRILRENSRLLYQTGQKLTLFPDGSLSNTWCNN
jgi:MoaA/NifB/PqqE/SkfB family radical SAM enzyme